MKPADLDPHCLEELMAQCLTSDLYKGSLIRASPEELSYVLKDIDYCQIEIIKGLTDKGQFQYLAKSKGPQEGTYLYTTQFLSLR